MNAEKINAAINAIIPCYDGMNECSYYFGWHKGLRSFMWKQFPPADPLKWVPILDVLSDAENTVKLTVRYKHNEVPFDFLYPQKIEQNIVADIVEIAKRIHILKNGWHRIANNPEWTPTNGNQRFILGKYWNFGWDLRD